MKFTREQYLNKECTHSTYYGQFVTNYIKEVVASRVGVKTICASKDEHFNDIPLGIWDNLPIYTSGSLSDKVCIAKEAARQIKEENKEK